LDIKEHPEYGGHQRVVRALKEEMTRVRYDEPLDSVRAVFAPLIKYLEGTIGQYNKDERNERKMRYAAYNALGKIHYWLDEPDETIKCGELLIANKFAEDEGKELIQLGTDLKKLFEKNGVNSRHFALDTEHFEGPK